MDRGGHPNPKLRVGKYYCHSKSQLLPLSSSSSRIPKKQKKRAFMCSTASAAAPIATALEQTGGKMLIDLVGAYNQLTQEINVLSSSSSRLLFKSLKLYIPILHALPLAPNGRPPLSKALSLALLLAHPQLPLSFLMNPFQSKSLFLYFSSLFYGCSPTTILPFHDGSVDNYVHTWTEMRFGFWQFHPYRKILHLANGLQMDAEVISAGLLIQEAGAISIYQVRDRIGTGTAHLFCMKACA